ncbi:MAG: hypothetical protein ABI644_06985 [Arenimonas sp.]
MRVNIAALFVTVGFIGSVGTVEASNPSQDQVITNSPLFIAEHPDLKYRLRGVDAYKKAQFGGAFTNFKRAARYADKPSQGMLAEMLWKGEGVAADRVQAYAWIDIAAEREYPAMILSREKMWSQLSEDERKQAVAVSLELHKYYGDNIAKNRLEVALRRAKTHVLGSRVGYVGYSHLCLDMTGLEPTDLLVCKDKVDGSDYYQDKFWKPKDYWQWQDIAWKDPAVGTVSIGKLQAPSEKPAPVVPEK